MFDLWEKIITFGVPAFCILAGGLLKTIWDGRTKYQETEANREKDLFRRVHELWEQEIERHELCEDEVKRLQRQVQAMLIALAQKGIQIKEDVVNERLLKD